MGNNQNSKDKDRDYSAKFKDPRWQKLRLEVLKRDDFTCQICFDSESTLHVHHRYYLPSKDPWDYPIEALVTLCESCHLGEKESRPDYERMLLKVLRQKGFFANHIYCLVEGFYNLDFIHTHDVIASMIEWSLKDHEVQKMLLEKYFKYLNEKNKQ